MMYGSFFFPLFFVVQLDNSIIDKDSIFKNVDAESSVQITPLRFEASNVPWKRKKERKGRDCFDDKL